MLLLSSSNPFSDKRFEFPRLAIQAIARPVLQNDELYAALQARPQNNSAGWAAAGSKKEVHGT
jgi:hypothetical protein